MKKNYPKSLIIVIGLFAAGVFFGAAFSARADELPKIVVSFEQNPLFKDANLLPGSEVTRVISVTNNSETAQKIIIEAINFTQPIPVTDLARILSIEIKKNNIALYGPRGLNYFYTDGEIYLSDLDSGQTAQYTVTVSFDINASDEWQERTTGFDILVGFQGQEGGEPPASTGGISGTSLGSGGLKPGLTISGSSVKIADTTPTSVTITWLTSYAATSQVIYVLAGQPYSFNLSDNAGTPPLFGYPNSTTEDMEKVMAHSVTIPGLTPGMTYYYRTVSHGSLAISREYNFTTPSSHIEKAAAPVAEIGISDNADTTPTPLTIMNNARPADNFQRKANQANMTIDDTVVKGVSVSAFSADNILGTSVEKDSVKPALITSHDDFSADKAGMPEPQTNELFIWAIIVVFVMVFFYALSIFSKRSIK
jgi:hypothetical protein